MACCQKFEENSNQRNDGFEQDKSDGTWSVNGCCGGGCYVLTGIIFCPFCGTDIASTNLGERHE